MSIYPLVFMNKKLSQWLEDPALRNLKTNFEIILENASIIATTSYTSISKTVVELDLEIPISNSKRFLEVCDIFKGIFLYNNNHLYRLHKKSLEIVNGPDG